MDLPSTKTAPPLHAPDTTSTSGQPLAADPSQITPEKAGPRVLSPAQLAQQADARQRTDVLLRDLWKRKLPIVRDQLRTLERALETLDTATLAPPLRSDAAMAAHKLAGSLGMFGYHNGTLFARQLEACLNSEQPIPRTVFADALQQLIASLNLASPLASSQPNRYQT